MIGKIAVACFIALAALPMNAFCQGQRSGGVAATAREASPELQQAVVDTYLTAACQQAYNQISNPNSVPGMSQIPDAGAVVKYPDGSIKYSYTPSPPASVDANVDDLCGSYVVLPVLFTPQKAFTRMQTTAIFAGEYDIQNFIPPAYRGRWTGRMPKTTNTHLESMIAAYADATTYQDRSAIKTARPQVSEMVRRQKLSTKATEAITANIMANFQEWVNSTVKTVEARPPTPAVSPLPPPSLHFRPYVKPRDDGLLSWLTYWPVLAGMAGIGAMLCWLLMNLPGARQVKAAWAQVCGPARPRLRRAVFAIARNRGKLWTFSLILAATLEVVRETVPGQSRVWSATYTGEALSVLVAALLTISAVPRIVGMFFTAVTWQIVGWTFRMVWGNLYQFGRYGISALVAYFLQFAWLDGHIDPLGHYVADIIAAGKALMAVLRTGDLGGLTLALPAAAAGAGDNYVLLFEWLWFSVWRVAELLCLIVMARYAIAALIALCRGFFHLIVEHLQSQPEIRTQTPHGQPPDDWRTI